MGTFHDNLGELHGITVEVETSGGAVHVGRCHEANDQHVLLLDVATHRENEDGLTNADWLKRAAKWGVFGGEKVMKLPREQVTNITRLGDVATR